MTKGHGELAEFIQAPPTTTEQRIRPGVNECSSKHIFYSSINLMRCCVIKTWLLLQIYMLNSNTFQGMQCGANYNKCRQSSSSTNDREIKRFTLSQRSRIQRCSISSGSDINNLVSMDTFQIMPRPHLHVKVRPNIELDVAISWQLRGLRRCYGVYVDFPYWISLLERTHSVTRCENTLNLSIFTLCHTVFFPVGLRGPCGCYGVYVAFPYWKGHTV